MTHQAAQDRAGGEIDIEDIARRGLEEIVPPERFQELGQQLLQFDHDAPGAPADLTPRDLQRALVRMTGIACRLADYAAFLVPNHPDIERLDRALVWLRRNAILRMER